MKQSTHKNLYVQIGFFPKLFFRRKVKRIAKRNNVKCEVTNGVQGVMSYFKIVVSGYTQDVTNTIKDLI